MFDFVSKVIRRAKEKVTADGKTKLSIITFFENLSKCKAINVDLCHAVVMMNNDVYAEYMCNGPFSPMDDSKAHAFMRGARMWMTFRRGMWCGDIERQLPANTLLSELSEEELAEYGLPSKEDIETMCKEINDDDWVGFGVLDTNGKAYIVGREREGEIVTA